MSVPTMRERFTAIGITSGGAFARYAEAPAVIFFFAKAKGDSRTTDHRAELTVYMKDGSVSSRTTFRPLKPKKISEARVETVTLAKEASVGMIGSGEWTRTPFANSWVPSEAYLAAVEKLEATEAQ